MSEREIKALLEDIHDVTRKILSYTKDMLFDDFINDDKTIDAVIRNFAVIGEAANRIAPDFQITHPNIEWRRIIGFRNRIIHEYFGIDYEILWQISQENIPELEDNIHLILEELQ